VKLDDESRDLLGTARIGMLALRAGSHPLVNPAAFHFGGDSVWMTTSRHAVKVVLANRDPAAYPDRPDRLDITRPNIRPHSFGGGIHFCLGAQLARIEAEVAISTLLQRLPDLKLDNAENPDWRPTFVLRGLQRLPARW